MNAPPLLLVVDDDADIREMLATILGSHGFDVTTASDGYEALLQLEEMLPDLILLDMRMPRMNGWEFAKTLDARGSRPPIMVITAAADPAARAAEIDAESWLAKPFDINRALEQIHSTLRQHRPRAPVVPDLTHTPRPNRPG